MKNSLAAEAAIRFVGWYKRWLSPLLGKRCRFHPSCSEYMTQALQKYGFLVGSAKGVWRIIRCNPFNSGGYDPVEKNDR